MLNHKLAGEIVSEIKKVSNKPVTVKFRKGYDDDNINAIEFAKIMDIQEQMQLLFMEELKSKCMKVRLIGI